VNLKYSRQLVASLSRLTAGKREAVAHTVDWFAENPLADGLANHPLFGRMAVRRAIAVDGDLRIVFRERGEYAEATLLDVGRHGNDQKSVSIDETMKECLIDHKCLNRCQTELEILHQIDQSLAIDQFDGGYPVPRCFSAGVRGKRTCRQN
jgi:mRNA-degrading endonuclease YafQ of YafQ-DinJ toxin-antitoxin module